MVLPQERSSKREGRLCHVPKLQAVSVSFAGTAETKGVFYYEKSTYRHYGGGDGSVHGRM